MAEPLKGCNSVMTRNLCTIAWGAIAFIAAGLYWFAPIYITEAHAQDLLEKEFAAHVTDEAKDQDALDKKLDTIITGQTALQLDVARVKERLGISTVSTTAQASNP